MKVFIYAEINSKKMYLANNFFIWSDIKSAKDFKSIKKAKKFLDSHLRHKTPNFLQYKNYIYINIYKDGRLISSQKYKGEENNDTKNSL